MQLYFKRLATSFLYFVRYCFIIDFSFVFDLIIMAYGQPNFYATMDIDSPIIAGITVGKILLGIVIFGYFIPKFSKKSE